ncbi:hypothetical protein [Kurthia sibirica]|uniref:Single-stranded DNA-binding protein n=2 Tax=Kurthia sibirica TaxID=202750 RepID=A0A2U3AGU3_9BACL|nr:hypothetical protein [Kurthia sibirica]PWI23737.1 hypothetical protein DEX24_15705 [Kurthia sibirica]GEK35567.1 hypothetical protein KSI01_31000 [Kurthia sibirica]
MTNFNNNAQFIGRLARQPLVKAHKPNAQGVVTSATVLLTVAVKDTHQSTQADGTKGYGSQFVSVNAFVKDNNLLNRYKTFGTGDLVRVEAHIESNTHNGTHYQNIVVDAVVPLETKDIRDTRKANRSTQEKTTVANTGGLQF